MVLLPSIFDSSLLPVIGRSLIFLLGFSDFPNGEAAPTGFGCKVSCISVGVSPKIHLVIGLTACGAAMAGFRVAVSLVVAGTGAVLVMVAGDDVGRRRKL
ncbi:hypothetical protein RHMOL_Rhmol02G0220800 [Rhododendron molle]|uniref:Uncharacterized protein n=1 Tax=Rhododendron molle TaxID=49168 RepID=A0ACC0PSM5_RHOML|nr:hypothetical protein RHMOL_Rhmol02G0220800 [Rhododendron molle]